MKLLTARFVFELLGGFLEHLFLIVGWLVFAAVVFATCAESLPPSPTQEQPAPRVYACECDEVGHVDDGPSAGR